MPNPIQDTAFSKEHLLTCKGYDANFIKANANIHFNILSKTQSKALPKVEGNKQGYQHYTRYSTAFNKNRKVPWFSCSNIDGSLKRDQKADGIKRPSSFIPDPRIDETIQLNNNFYDLIKAPAPTEFEIGHMCSNDEMCWGKTVDDAKLYAYETFFFSNSVPQAESLNSGLWRSLEQYVLDQINKTDSKKISVFSGPVINDNDPAYVKDTSFQVPLLFWKIVVFEYKKQLKGIGFLMSHEKRLNEMKMLVKKPAIKKAALRAAPLETPPFEDYKHKQIFQVSIETIEQLTKLSFGWKNVIRIAVEGSGTPMQLKKIKEVASSNDLKASKSFRAASPAKAVTKKQYTLNIKLD